MGVFDKIKNALFEVEYVEVDEKPKKEKKFKPKEKTKEKKHEEREERPIAKKIVLPEKKEDKVEEIEEEELRDDDFEFRPKYETIKEEKKNSFKFMDDEDFKVNDEPHIVEVLDDEEKLETKKYDRIESDYSHDEPINSDVYRIKEKESKPYGLDNTYKVSMHEYGTYEKKDEKVYFKPSPIISPIYGILDKNYKKEDVVSKKDIRITSNYSRTNVNVDDIRNKAFGRRGNSKVVESSNEENTTFDIEEDEENLLVDLSDDKDKPEVKQVTVGDAMEYFQDLGLEYNVDYVDASKDKESTKKVDAKLEEDIKKEMEDFETDVEKENKKKTTQQEVKEDKIDEKDDDNLFDLIDSMYKDEN